jgi:hypothetical protein
MHLVALGEGLAVDPAENVAALLVEAKPARRGVETGALEVHKHVAHHLSAAPRRHSPFRPRARRPPSSRRRRVEARRSQRLNQMREGKSARAPCTCRARFLPSRRRSEKLGAPWRDRACSSRRRSGLSGAGSQSSPASSHGVGTTTASTSRCNSCGQGRHRRRKAWHSAGDRRRRRCAVLGSANEPFVLRRLGGVVVLAATALFVVQLGRRIGWDNLSAGNIEAGPYLAGDGGLLVLLSPSGLWPFTRRRSRSPL